MTRSRSSDLHGIMTLVFTLMKYMNIIKSVDSANLHVIDFNDSDSNTVHLLLGSHLAQARERPSSKDGSTGKKKEYLIALMIAMRRKLKARGLISGSSPRNEDMMSNFSFAPEASSFTLKQICSFEFRKMLSNWVSCVVTSVSLIMKHNNIGC